MSSEPSKVWKYFTIDEDDEAKAVCSPCGAKIKKGVGKKATTSSLWNHLKFKHPEIFKKRDENAGITIKPQLKCIPIIETTNSSDHVAVKETDETDADSSQPLALAIVAMEDSMPLQQRMLLGAPQVQIPSSSESLLHSQPLSPTKLKVTRQSGKAPATYTPKIVESPPVMPPEEVCLRWNSHHSNMQTSFPQLLEKEQYVDVTLIAEGKTLKCHRIILSSCSTYFEEILNDITPLQHPVIILKGIPFWILKSLTDFMYVGEVNIDQNKLPELLDIAELLKVKGLAGKSSSSDKQEKQEKKTENPPPKKPQQAKEAHSRPYIAKTPQQTPVTTKSEEMAVTDPLELLEPLFHCDDSSSSKNRERLSGKRFLVKKIRKRKSSEDEMPLPLFPMRRGTRSRPNVKIPKYYDYEDIVKPSASDSQLFSPVLTIKSEPLDADENEAYNEIANSSHSTIENSNTSAKPAAKPESLPARNKSPKEKEKEHPALQYKIKIKSISSLTSETSNCKTNEPECLKTNEADSPKTNEVDSPKTNEVDGPKTNEVDGPKTNEAECPKINETDCMKTDEADCPKTNEVDCPKTNEVDCQKISEKAASDKELNSMEISDVASVCKQEEENEEGNSVVENAAEDEPLNDSTNEVMSEEIETKSEVVETKIVDMPPLEEDGLLKAGD